MLPDRFREGGGKLKDLHEKEYGMEVTGYYLAVVHPESPGPRLISCPRLAAELRAIHQYEMECGRASESAPGPHAPAGLP